MKKILYTFLIFSSAILFGQKNSKVKFAICNGAVGTTEMFEPYKKDIESTTFLRLQQNYRNIYKSSVIWLKAV
ncbi:hypothetical protein [Chryseobacterium sp. 3008163]|uniref:hypothetical protein n=1 Tax=Chryseobacterium sp. 3008163 TaxID=2478663 RepID=UPI001013D206|nr:hypothetical protein [Chryseobacterium sp. 3008163]